MDKFEKAYAEWCGRQDGELEPSGYVVPSGKWWPSSETEWCACCALVAKPTVGAPKTLWNHCKTIEHVATKYGLGWSETCQLYRRYRNQEKKQEWEWF